MTEFVPQDESQFVFRLDLVEQSRRDDNQPAGQCHGVGNIGVVDLDTKFIRRVAPVKCKPVQQQLRLV